MSSLRRRLLMQCMQSSAKLIYYGNKTGIGGYIKLDYEYLFVCTLSNGDIVLGNCNYPMRGNSSSRYYVYFPVESSFNYYSWNVSTQQWDVKNRGTYISVEARVTLGNGNIQNYGNFTGLGFNIQNYSQSDWEV